MVQVSANVIAIILFLGVPYIMKKFREKGLFGIKDEEIIRLLFSSLERAILFSN